MSDFCLLKTECYAELNSHQLERVSVVIRNLQSIFQVNLPSTFQDSLT